MKDLEMETESININLTTLPTPAVTNPTTGTLMEGLNPPESSPQENQYQQSTSSSAQSTNLPRATRNPTAIVNHPRRHQRQQPPIRRCLLHLVQRCTRNPHNRHPPKY